MADDTTSGIHLFHGTRLLANLRTTDGPQSSYLIEGITYNVTARNGPYLEADGSEAWDLQVEPA